MVTVNPGSIVPLIDLSGSDSATSVLDVAGTIADTCGDLGTFLIAGHGIDRQLIEEVRDVSRAFFALPDAIKHRCASPSGNSFRGWAPTEIDGPSGRIRIHEQFQVSRFDSPEDVRAAGYAERWVGRAEANRWPATPATFESSWKAYFDAMDRLGNRLLDLIAVGLDLAPNWFAEAFTRPASFLACNLYESPGVDTGRRARLGSHTDIGSLTILHQDDGPGGLQVRDRHGRWHDVPSVPDTLVVNLGDLFAMWTNGRWAATEHRVVNPPVGDNRSRMSVAYFQSPDLDAVIECIPSCRSAGDPPLWPPVIAGDWTRQRMDAYSGA